LTVVAEGACAGDIGWKGDETGSSVARTVPGYRIPPSRARHHLAPDFTTSTTTTLEATEPRTIVEIAMFLGVELYRSISY
jgi:hypothetical protein